MGVLKSIHSLSVFPPPRLLCKLQKFCWSVLSQLTLLSCIFYYWDHSVKFPSRTVHIQISHLNFFLIISFHWWEFLLMFFFFFLNFMFASFYCPKPLLYWFWSVHLCIIQRLVWGLYGLVQMSVQISKGSLCSLHQPHAV